MNYDKMSREELIEALKSAHQHHSNLQSGVGIGDHEKSLYSLFKKISDGVGYHVLGTDGFILDINQAELDMIGYSRDRIVGKKKWEELIVPEQRLVYQTYREKLIKDGEIHNLNLTLLNNRGKHFEVALNALAIIDDGGCLRQIHGLVIDISSHKYADQLQRRLSAIVEHSDDAVIGKTLDGVITSWNVGAEKMYGYKAKEVLGKYITIIQPKDTPEDIPKIMQKIRRGESIKHYETRRCRKNGEIFHVSVTVSPVKDKNGKIVGASAISRDISSRKKFEEKLKNYADELKQSNQALERFAYVVAHDLQSPLVTIQGFADLLLQESAHKLNEEERDSLQSMIKASKRMNKLIKDLLMLSRATHQNVSIRPVDMNKLIQNVKKDLKSAIEQSKAVIEVDPLPKIEGDASQLYSVFLNLISNAIKYNNSSPPVVKISSATRNGSQMFSVQDNGIGLKPNQAKRVFDPFERFAKESADKGSGLGLSICKKIIERHNGFIWVETELKKGSIFYFTLPGKQKSRKMAV